MEIAQPAACREDGPRSLLCRQWLALERACPAEMGAGGLVGFEFGLMQCKDRRFTAAQRAAADVAEVVVLGTMAGAFVEQVEDQIVNSQRLGDVKLRAGVIHRRLGGQTGNVAGPVFSRPQEKWTNHHARCAAFHASSISRCDGGFGQLHMGGFHDVIFTSKSLAEKSGDFFQHAIALGSA